MNNLSKSAQLSTSGTHWNDTPDNDPAKSGLYQTRDANNQTWFKYFDANRGFWYMSWAELKANASSHVGKISASDITRHVVAWASCSKNSTFI